MESRNDTAILDLKVININEEIERSKQITSIEAKKVPKLIKPSSFTTFFLHK